MLSDHVREQVIAVAYSGGRDSTALLHACAVAAKSEPALRVVALHVHHGLSALADDWLAHAQMTCDEWARAGLPVSLVVRRVSVDVSGGASVEARARAARYAALSDMVTMVGGDLLLLAHHRRDQAETFLLQALRGAGVAGLACMPKDEWRDGIRWVRPWLDHPREAIEAYVAAHRLQYVEDDSNSDVRFARNRLRASVWPALLEAFPDAERALASSGSKVADALPAMASWHQQLLQSATVPSDVGTTSMAYPDLNAIQWAVWAVGARREALRAWYQQVAGRSLTASWVYRLADEVPGMIERQSSSNWDEIGVSLYRGLLSYSSRRSPRCASGVSEVSAVTLGPLTEGVHRVASWLGCLHVRRVEIGGVSAQSLEDVALRPRVGGEQFQSAPGRPLRALRKQFQCAGVPSWLRQGPLVYGGGRLLWVPGLGVDARAVAPDGDPQYAFEWHPDSSSAT
ncbi:MAG: tRNA lysidine(34) synthetase TilS [Aquabacterium sp.]|uniref:tRNA lysidine(34) synthetase TilS n=1 Tax=Aquabacterium sp. TaxID=1872578 RepID=UPI003BE45729